MLGLGDLWYKDAVVYALNVETFQDSNADADDDIIELFSDREYGMPRVRSCALADRTMPGPPPHR